MINQVNDALGFHQKALALRAYRQEVLASNIANAVKEQAAAYGWEISLFETCLLYTSDAADE